MKKPTANGITHSRAGTTELKSIFEDREKFRKKLEYILFLPLFFHLYRGENGIGDR
jgi:hypothetical protein